MFHQRLGLKHPYRATAGQRALHSQAINKSGFIMKPNESPSIFQKQARDLRVLQEEQSLPALENKQQTIGRTKAKCYTDAECVPLYNKQQKYCTLSEL